MSSFLYTVATQLHQRFAGNMHTVAVVFPNRRQSVFFSHHFQQIATPPCFLPAMLTIEELLATSTKWQMADSLTQGFALYEAFATQALQAGDAPQDIPPFDVFFTIGETILKDFKEIDSYLVNIHDLCKVLYDIETIDKAFDQLTEEQKQFLQSFWESSKGKSQIQEKFLKLWQRLPAIYTKFQQILEQQQLTTMGMAYRQLAAGIPQNQGFETQWSHIAFVGFNALNKAEETFLKKWNDAGLASLWLDADEWYVNQKEQEAGFFIRRNLQKIKLKNELPLLQVIENLQTPIEVISTEGESAQAKAIALWYARQQTNNTAMQMGILLADESLLIPTLQSLPDSIENINITMGFPLQQSPVFSVVKLFFDIQSDMAKHGYKAVHHSLATQWLQHPFCNWKASAKAKLQEAMVKQNLVRVPLHLLAQNTTASVLLFSRMMADMEAFQRLRQLLEAAMALPATKDNSMNRGLCVAAWQALQKLELLFAKLSPQPTLSFIGKMLQKQLGSLTIPFEGEPLQGLQLMGLLESRGLDFEHLIILGASEGILPRIKPPDSFIPHNVRRAFEMPIPEHQDAIFAYVFYRLLHRAKTVQVVHNSLISDSSSGEVSRFIKQLEFEIKPPINYSSIHRAVYPASFPAIAIPKSQEILNRLYHYYKSENPTHLSPSAINLYLNCRLQFFFRYIALLKKPDILDEGVEAAAVGSVVHMLMELLYKEWKNKSGNTITAEAIDWMKQQAEKWVETAFKKSWRSIEVKGDFEFTGVLHIVREIVIQYAQKTLDLDAKYVPFTVIALETKLDQPFAAPIQGNEQRVVLKGLVDRIDEKSGVFRMVDYKTGSDRPDFQSIEALFERDSTQQNKAALQTLIYSWMFHKTYPQHSHFYPALLAVRHLQNKPGDSFLRENAGLQQIDQQNIYKALEKVEEGLRNLVSELFDPQVPFTQTTLLKNCEYCDYKELCGR